MESFLKKNYTMFTLILCDCINLCCYINLFLSRYNDHMITEYNFMI